MNAILSKPAQKHKRRTTSKSVQFLNRIKAKHLQSESDLLQQWISANCCVKLHFESAPRLRQKFAHNDSRAERHKVESPPVEENLYSILCIISRVGALAQV